MKLDINSVRHRFILFSSVLFLFIFATGGAAFTILLQRVAYENAVSELTRIVEVERIKLEAVVNGEIALVRSMADSVLVKRYFLDPADPEQQGPFMEELEGYRKAFNSNSLFWINDIDKLFHFTGAEPYKVDPDAPVNYWYNLTLYETETYNFNINYNPDIRTINLWVNSPVFDAGGKPIGMVGTGLELNAFIDSIFEDIPDGMDIYFFNEDGEITSARDVALIENKVHLAEAAGPLGEEILAAARNLPGSGAIEIFETRDGKYLVALCEIPVLGWHMSAVHPISVEEFLPAGLPILSIFMIACFLLFVLLIILLSARMIFRPLEKLSDSVERMGINSMERLYGLERDDEFGHLANTIEDMKNRISSIQYASRIQKNLLPKEEPFKEAFADYSILWNPRDIVGGDIYWIRNYSEGTVLCVCDCTGHGTPGAMLTMLAIAALDSLVSEKNFKDPAQIILELDRRFLTTINAGAPTRPGETQARRRRGADIKDGCDLAVLYIAKDGSVAFASGNIDILLCDGACATRLRGQKLQIGAGILTRKEEIKTVNLPAHPGRKLYIASDGLYEQTGGEKELPLGFGAVEKIILENHNESQSAISDKIWRAFEEYRGDSMRCDDVLLISLKV